MKPPYIELKKVCYSINKRHILSELDMTIEQSDFISLVGDNGCGKTTLTKLILGIIRPDSGDIKLDGIDVKKYKLHEVGKKIGYVFQNPSYQIFAPTIQEELSFAMKYKGTDDETIKAKIDEMMQRFELNDIKEVTTYNLSQGEKQRLAIACMMLNEPEFIILDEPTVGLDNKRKNELLSYLKSINNQGIGVLLISHDKNIVHEHSKKIIHMKDGKIND